MYSWDSPRTLVPLILGITGLTVFVFYEHYLAVEPLISLSLFNNRSAAVTYLGTVAHGIIVSPVSLNQAYGRERY